MLNLFQYPKLFFKRVRFSKLDTFSFYIEILIKITKLSLKIIISKIYRNFIFNN